MNIRVIYLEYTARRRSHFRDELRPFVARLFPSAQIDFVIVDNAGEAASEPDGVRVISGDNSVREFSGWQKALDGTELRNEDTIVFANDTFASNYGEHFLDWFGATEVRRALDRGCAIGYVDDRPDNVEICGLTLRRWLRTSLFILRGRELKKILPLVPCEFSPFFAVDGDSLFSLHAPLSPNLRRSLDRWLVGKPLPAGDYDGGLWHSSAPLTDANRRSMQEKAQCIFCELLLSARLRQHNIALYDVRTSWRRAGGLFALADRLGLLSVLRRWRQRCQRV